MHDLGFDHFHPDAEEREHLSNIIWEADNVEMTTLGFDIGSSTSHLMFARVHLQRAATGLSSRFEVVGRDVLWRSPVTLTPYQANGDINAHALGHFFDDACKQSGIARDAVDTGAVILTGEALKRQNAHAIADLFSRDGGKFVCATAGHHLEAAMAANGSGAVALSRREKATVLNVDIGGGTTKLALIENGTVLATAAFAVGGRLVAVDENNLITRLDGPAAEMARHLGLDLSVGTILLDTARKTLSDFMAATVAGMIAGDTPDAFTQSLMVTEMIPETMGASRPTVLTFSGGVSEYIFERETAGFGDLGGNLSHSLRHLLAENTTGLAVWDPGQGIRATVIGASQFSVQVSGNTIFLPNEDILPLRNVPVLGCDVGGADDVSIDPVRVWASLSASWDAHGLDGLVPAVAVAFQWQGEPDHSRLFAVASGLEDFFATPGIACKVVVLLIDGDIGMTLGRILKNETDLAIEIVSIDGLHMKPFDYVDAGKIERPSGVVPVIIKSLLF
jgi:ethanolamine utilization protein EutA